MLLKAGTLSRSVSLAENCANELIMLVKGSRGRPELILAFREDGKILTSYKSPTDHAAVLGIIVLAFLDSQLVHQHHYLCHHRSSG